MRFSTILTRVAPLAAIVTLPLGAQQSVVGNGVNIAGESATERAPLFTSSAFLAKKSSYGFALQAEGVSQKQEEGDVEYTIGGSRAVFSGYYGVTSKLTLGGYVQHMRGSEKLEGAGALDGEEDYSGMGDAGVFGRFGAFKSQSGNSRVAILGSVNLPTASGDFEVEDGSAYYALGAALSHRMGRWSLHASPEINFVKDMDAQIDFNVAGVFAASPKMNLSVEMLTANGGAPSDVDGAEGVKDIDLGGGLRYRFGGRLAVDGGLRYNLSTRVEEGAPEPTRVGVLLGLNWQF